MERSSSIDYSKMVQDKTLNNFLVGLAIAAVFGQALWDGIEPVVTRGVIDPMYRKARSSIYEIFKR